ncbi:hypothetical protein MMC09_003625 [Bachmanniomyces sp. S44760]|nr:hypothetical protein [Bachmanniomyces sp. S44760]
MLMYQKNFKESAQHLREALTWRVFTSGREAAVTQKTRKQLARVVSRSLCLRRPIINGWDYRADGMLTLQHSEPKTRFSTPRKSHHRNNNNESTPPKYCSDKCRRQKPSQSRSGIERKIEDTFVKCLDSKDGKRGKEEGGKIVLCSEVEDLVFGAKEERSSGYHQSRGDGSLEGHIDMDVNVDVDESHHDRVPHKDHEESFSSSSEAEAEAELEEGGVLLPVMAPSTVTTTNNSTPTPTPRTTTPTQTPSHPSPSLSDPQQKGQRLAHQRELVRQAARRGIAFGFIISHHHRREEGNGDEGKGKKSRENEQAQGHKQRKKVEAVQKGKVVESSFAKGEWGVRWRD